MFLCWYTGFQHHINGTCARTTDISAVQPVTNASQLCGFGKCCNLLESSAVLEIAWNRLNSSRCSRRMTVTELPRSRLA
ncbi:hypothetical protein V1264_015636 [Littorina saxatilis]|uniref:Uncharacterized protein n=1 Tax=Littorina saxatilis TaxID=31220 RepID=A0AAN9GH73_9CAEN